LAVCRRRLRRAEINPNFVKRLSETVSACECDIPPSPPELNPPAIPDLVRNGQLPLTMGDLINLILQEQSRYQRHIGCHRYPRCT